MPAADDRWDVVVVGLRDPSQANAVMVVAELAHYASLPPQDIERMLFDDGEVPVLASLDRAEAERAAYEISELGAVVDLRLTLGEGGVFPVLKPDAERQIGVAVGGLIDDSATPPTMGEIGESLALTELEPDLEGPGEPRARRQTPRPGRAGRSRTPVPSPPPFAGPPGLGLGVEDEPPPPPMPAGRPAEGGRAPKPEGRSPRPARPAGQASHGGLDALLGDIGGVPSGGDAPQPKLPKRLQRAKDAGARPEQELELDFEAAGMARPPRAGRPAAAHAEPAADPRRTRAGNMGGTGASAAGRARSEGGVLGALRGDGVASLLLGLGVGLVLGLVLAVIMQRSDVKERLPPLEDELAAALHDPAGVAAGKHREPSAIEGEIDDALGDVQRTFLLWWLVPGVVVGLGLSRLWAR